MSSISIIYSSFFSRNNEIESESDDEKQLVNLEHCSIHDVPQEILIYHIFNRLSFNDLCRAACVCRRWSQLISFPDFWDLKRFFSISQILDKQAWETFIDVKKLGLSFDDKECNPRKIACMLEHFTQTVEIENHAGFSYIVLPKGLSINKLMTLQVPIQINHRINMEIGDYTTEKTHHFIISNSILQGSRGNNCEKNIENLKQLGCEMPTVALMTSVLVLQYLVSSNNPTCQAVRNYGDNPITFTRCSDVIDEENIVVGGFLTNGFFIHNYTQSGSHIVGVGVAKKMT